MTNALPGNKTATGLSAAIAISGLDFAYPRGEGIQFNNFSLSIQEGERFGLFGPNGAGKTTLIHLMTGILSHKHGRIELFGTPVDGRRKTVNGLFGFVPQDFSFYQELTPMENLAFFGAWAGLSRDQIRDRAEKLMDLLGLSDVRDRRVGKFSGGMKRRVNLAIAVIHQPRILFLDEPTVGVDVQSRHAIIAYLKSLNEAGTTLVYTSHQLDEAEELCTRIAMIDDGQIVAHDTLAVLMAAHAQEGLEGLFLSLTGKSFRD